MAYYNVKAPPYNAKGDGTTNDTMAFQQVAAAVNAAGGGCIVIPRGTYIVGAQTRGPAEGPYWNPEPILPISGCKRSVVIQGAPGAILKAEAGLHFGSFDPATGLTVDNPATGPVDTFQVGAYVGMIELYGNSSITVRKLELDGNLGELNLGGVGKDGRQCAGSGIFAVGNTELHIEDLWIHHHALDGILLINRVTPIDPIAETPVTLIRLNSEYNGRCGISWHGGIGLYATDCRFNHTGRGGLASDPACGMDVETTDVDPPSIARKGRFIGCEFANVAGRACVISDYDETNWQRYRDVEDLQFDNCTFWGSSSWALWPKRPGFVFRNCRIYGGVVNAWSKPTPIIAGPGQPTRFEGCYFEDRPYPQAGVFRKGTNSLIEIGGPGVILDGCTLVANYGHAIYCNYRGMIAKNCVIVHRWAGLTSAGAAPSNNAFQSNVVGMVLENVTFLEDLDTAPLAYRWYINHQADVIFIGDSFVEGPRVTWGLGGGVGVIP